MLDIESWIWIHGKTYLLLRSAPVKLHQKELTQIAHYFKIITNYKSYLHFGLLDLGRHQDGQRAQG